MGNGLLDKNMKQKSRLERLIDIELPQNIRFSSIDGIHLIEIQDRVRGRTSMKFDIYGQGLTIVNLFRQGIDRSGRILTNFDIYGQGLTFMKIVIEPHGFYGHREMCSKISIELVLGNWRKRLQATTKDTTPEEYCQQMKKCIETALKPVEHDRHQWPSIIRDTIHMLNKTDNLIFFSLQDIHMHEIEDTNLLEVHPKKLRFPFVRKKCVSCSLLLNNRTDDRMAFRLIGKNKRNFVPTLPHYGVVPPSCTYILALTMRNQLQKPASDSEEALTLQRIRLTHDQDLQLKNFDQDTVAKEYEILFNKSEEEARDNVRKVMLKIVCDLGVEHASSMSKQTEPEIKIIPIPNAQQVSSIEVHPTETWIMTTHHAGNIRVWNYETMAALNSFQVTDEAVYAAKFIAREKWIVAGDANGCIHVYSYDEGQDIVSFEAHDGCIVSLAVHPTGPYVLSSSHDDHLIKLWHWDRDWDLEKGWVCTRTFEGQSGWVCTRTFEERSNKVSRLISNSEDTSGFVSVSWDCTIKVWSLYSDVSNAITLLENLDDLLCVDYITGDDRQHLITGLKDGTAQVSRIGLQKNFISHVQCIISL
ncbi:hypothetical protein ACP4OV_029137 [Aristida adscensionis]